MAIGPNVVDDCEGMTEEDYWRAMQDKEGDEPFCNCSAGHSIEETDWNQCDSCGKPIYDEEPAVSPAPTFADGMTEEDDRRFLELTNNLTHNYVIDALGGSTAAARFFEVTVGAISQWRMSGIPRARLMYLRAMRPDIYEAYQKLGSGETAIKDAA